MKSLVKLLNLVTQSDLEEVCGIDQLCSGLCSRLQLDGAI